MWDRKGEETGSPSGFYTSRRLLKHHGGWDEVVKCGGGGNATAATCPVLVRGRCLLYVPMHRIGTAKGEAYGLANTRQVSVEARP